MNNEVKHTPTPWHSKWSYIYDEDGFNIADTLSSNGRDLCRSNAAHIVKCVNLHDELVEALKKLLNEYLEIDLLNDETEEMTEACRMAREALKKAGAL